MVDFRRKPLEGIFPLTTFALKENQEVDYEAIRSNIELLIENGFPGFIAFGSMGSHHAPTEEEFNKVTDVSIDAANGKIACVIGASQVSFRQIIRRIKYAEDAGADGTMLLIPYAFPALRQNVAKYWKLVNDALKGEMAIMIYNDVNMTGFNHDVTFWKDTLLKLDNVKAVKEGAKETDDVLTAIADKVNVFSFTETQFFQLDDPLE